MQGLGVECAQQGQGAVSPAREAQGGGDPGFRASLVGNASRVSESVFPASQEIRFCSPVSPSPIGFQVAGPGLSSLNQGVGFSPSPEVLKSSGLGLFAAKQSI